MNKDKRASDMPMIINAAHGQLPSLKAVIDFMDFYIEQTKKWEELQEKKKKIKANRL